jgi:predicted RecB family nuclease
MLCREQNGGSKGIGQDYCVHGMGALRQTSTRDRVSCAQARVREYVSVMKITSPIFDAFLKCATKCHLRSLGEIGSGNEYAEWVRGRDESYQREAALRLQEAVPKSERVVAPPANENLKAAKWRLAVDLVAQTPDRLMDSSLGTDAMLTDHEPPTTHPSPSPLLATRGEGGRRPGEWRFIESDVRKLRPNEETRGLGAPCPEQPLESRLHAVERVPSEGRGKPAQFVPIRFVFRNKLTKDDRLLLAFDALVLSQVLGREVSLGKIIHGDDHATLKVRNSALAGEVWKRLEKLAVLLSNTTPPELVLNRHCAECEFQARCRKIAVEKDDLSLLAHMSAKERQKLRSKGIFTVTQLSYTFRPRRRPKRLRDKREKYHHSLKALAIREKKIHIVGSPELKIEGTPVYLDVEGLPDRDFYYLIGLRIGGGESAVQHSLWADTAKDEGKIWRAFLGVLERVEKPVLIHYGSYETTFFKRMCERHRKPPEGSVAAKAIEIAVNLLSVIFAHVYFPTQSNGLKQIAGYLGFRWSTSTVSGVHAIACRNEWSASKAHSAKLTLLAYNAEDCAALRVVTNKLIELHQTPSGADASSLEGIVDTTKLKREHPYGIKRNTFVFPELDVINKAAYWDYQRDRVFVKSSPNLRHSSRRASKRKRALSPDKTVECGRAGSCPKCDSKEIVKHMKYGKTVLDLKFMRHGVKRWITYYQFHRYLCQCCGATFYPQERCWSSSKYGSDIIAYALYLNIELRLPQIHVDHNLSKLFGFDWAVGGPTARIKQMAAKMYKGTSDALIKKLCSGRLLHADETKVSVRGTDGFVWVFANMEEVAYVYSQTREGDLLQTMLKDFRGVLVSDFYAAYDSIPCPQQKCLIHLIRDINDDVLKHPYDEELKRLAKDFALLLKPVVETVDRFGLKSRFLRKHLVAVDRFYRQIANLTLHTETAAKLKARLEKNQDKLFTFLNFDGVPWNNNNAEHAVKPFAKLRQIIGGSTTEKGVRDYLVLLSLCETCKYMGVDFLDFLRSGETDIHVFAESRRGRGRRTQISQLLGLPADVIPGPGTLP